MHASGETNTIKLIKNFINEDEANKVVSTFESLEEPDIYKIDKRVVTVDTKVELFRNIAKRVLLKARETFDDENLYISEFMISSYYPGYSMDVHTDIADRYHFSVSGVLYFNNDFTGGDIIFPNINYRYSPQLGDLVLFKSDLTENDHGVEEVTSGIRYVMPVWITSDKNLELDNWEKINF